MKRATLAALGAGAFLMLAGASAQAMPVGPAPAADAGLIEHVAQGCGPGFFRGPRGFCRPMGGGFRRGGGWGRPGWRGRGFYGPRRFHGGRW